MNRNKKIIYIMVVLLAVIAGWLYFENSSGKEVRAMGFPSIRAVPDGFDYAEAKSIDTGDWCEVTYENGRGGFVSLDCYVPGSFDTMFLDNYVLKQRELGGMPENIGCYHQLHSLAKD